MPTVVVHDLAEAVAAARAAAAEGAALTLRSPPGFGRSLGVGGWQALAEAVRAAVPNAEIAFCLDCADHVGDAQAAIAFGAKRIALSPNARGYARLTALAEAEAVAVEPGAADLDLAFIHDPEAATRRLLQNHR